MSATAQMAALGTALEKEVRDAGNALAVRVHRELVRRTPRASGEAQAGWTVDKGLPSGRKPSPPFQPETPAQIRGRLAGRRPGEDVVVSNAVDHMAAVERRRPFVQAAMSAAVSRNGGR